MISKQPFRELLFSRRTGHLIKFIKLWANTFSMWDIFVFKIYQNLESVLFEYTQIKKINTDD